MLDEPTIEARGELFIIGQEVRTSNRQEEDPAAARIPGLWAKIRREGWASKVPGVIKPELLYGVYTNYETDHRGEYTLVVGVEVNRLIGKEGGPRELVIPPSRYLVFKARGAMPGALIDAWKDIWEYFDYSPARRSYTSDFELHDKTKPDEVAVYIAIK